jgi:hypothetical protein
MPDVETIVEHMRKNPQNILYRDLCKVCDHYFGKARQQSSSHRIYKTSWQGDPRVNIQKDGNKAKAYQVRQVLKAIEKLEDDANER